MARPLRVLRPLRLLTAGVAAVALGLGPGALQASAATTSGSYESSVVKRANAERAKRHEHTLKASSCVDAFAERQARAMARSHTMYHQDLAPVLKKCHLSAVGENVAYGFDSGKAVTRAWMRSPGHRANLLRKGYRLIGVGAVRDDRGSWYVSQVFGTKR